ncbi:MAG: 2Fe-2S iron-sulfur cluster-binding protein [Opitutaceae bacterium]|nr:2Fe-2S iron-sulfur cluster-binding protein [Opitutaceae bacterium]
MSAITLTIDGQTVEALPGQSVLAAARTLGLDIPTLCHLEKCGPLTTCLVCLVRINGRLVPSCGTKVEPGMVVESETELVHAARRTALELLFSDHVGDCLSPCNLLCPLLLNIPVMIRQIEAGRNMEAIATVRQALPLPAVLGRLCHHPCEKGCRRGAHDDAAAIREMERFAADEDFRAPTRHRPPAKPATGKTVAIVGAGPTGLAASYFLAREGHTVRVFDRHEKPGGTLHRSVAEKHLPNEVLEAEVGWLEEFGVHFTGSTELGRDITLARLTSSHDAVVLAVGETAMNEAETLQVPVASTGIAADPNTCRTTLPAVFAAGAAVKPVKQLVRAMSEGRMVAECVSQFLDGRTVRRPDKPFSNIMGRLDAGELLTFVRTASPAARVSPCDACAAGLSRQAAAGEASRCLHCDCRSSGDCTLQHYARVYAVDANRFRSKRRTFEQQLQPGGVIFEPGKCILCGICVKLTETAREPLGLTFIGRGFNVRIGTPLNGTIEDGLQKVAAEVVHHCPTGALCFAAPDQEK